MTQKIDGIEINLVPLELFSRRMSAGDAGTMRPARLSISGEYQLQGA